MSEQTPSIGRVVHYQSRGSADGVFAPEPRAAIITRVNTDDTVDLCVLNPTGVFFDFHLQYSEDPEGGCWSWPPRV